MRLLVLLGLILIPILMVAITLVVIWFNGWHKHMGWAMLSGLMVVNNAILGFAIAYNIADDYWRAREEEDQAECLRVARRLHGWEYKPELDCEYNAYGALVNWREHYPWLCRHPAVLTDC